MKINYDLLTLITNLLKPIYHEKNFFSSTAVTIIPLCICSLEENAVSIDTASQNKLVIKQMNFADFKTNANDYSYFSQVENSLKTQISSAKMAYDTILDYYIDKEDITYIYSDSLRCYTMPIYRAGKTGTENLVLRYGANGDFAAMIVTYKFTQAEESNILNGIRVSVNPSVEVIVNTSKEICYTLVRVVSFTRIPGQLEFSEWVWVEVDCPPSSGDSGGGGGGNSGGGGSGGGGGNSGGSPDSGWFTGGPTIPGDYVSGGGGSNYGSGTISNGTSTITFADILTTPKLPLAPFRSILTAAQKDYWYDNADSTIIEYLKAYLMSNALSPESMDFAQWAVQFFIDNPGTTLDQFKNWFMGESEGQDGDYDAAYWENPNLTFPQQNLPSWSDFDAAFPKLNGSNMPSSQVYALVGGQLYASHLANPAAYSNACAVRVSRALNYSGVVIPNIPGQTEKGADNKNYFLSAANLNAWLKTFGNPTYHYTGTQGGDHGGNFQVLLSNKKGLYIMIPNYPAYFASGHADMWNGTNCVGRCYFDIQQTLPNGNMQGVAYINLWQLN